MGLDRFRCVWYNRIFFLANQSTGSWHLWEGESFFSKFDFFPFVNLLNSTKSIVKKSMKNSFYFNSCATNGILSCGANSSSFCFGIFFLIDFNRFSLIAFAPSNVFDWSSVQFQYLILPIKYCNLFVIWHYNKRFNLRFFSSVQRALSVCALHSSVD